MLVGCWGKIGDIVHTAPIAQFMGATLVYDPLFAAVGSLLDLLMEIPDHRAEAVDWGADDLGIPGAINCSHNQFRKDPLRNLNILDYWGQGYHSIDFHSAWCGITLSRSDRLLHFAPHVHSRNVHDSVVFVSNCDDPAMRGYPDDFMQVLGDYVQELGLQAYEVSRGDIVVGESRSHLDLGDVVQLMAVARLIISVDTMATGIIAQSLDVPIVRLYTGHTCNTGTGPTMDWDGCRHITAPSKPADVFPLIDQLWDWRENRGAS